MRSRKIATSRNLMEETLQFNVTRIKIMTGKCKKVVNVAGKEVRSCRGIWVKDSL